MKSWFFRILTVLFLAWAVHASFKALLPGEDWQKHDHLKNFSLENALGHVKALSQKPRYTGSDQHSQARTYILNALKKMGLNPTIQSGYSMSKWGELSYATNILAKIKGSKANSLALMLLSHYDSDPHSALGASDAASGVATILEGLRAYLQKGIIPKNDIVILFTDAEELGLIGAELFVQKHPWANDIGLILNFEARGSGGPSYMLIETNSGNASLIETFASTQPQWPVGNSLAYSIYKMLPNDTDLTVFREKKNIPGFNFAFIDDHFDYHTLRDNYHRLDHNSLKHQASYLMGLLPYFAENSLDFDTANDNIYFNVPFLGLIIYPYSWIWPLNFLVILFFLWIMFKGIRTGELRPKNILAGAVPFSLSLAIAVFAGYWFWPLLQQLYPAYLEIQQGFTYNGHWYIASVVGFTLSVAFCTYSYFKIKPAEFMVFPIVVSLAIVLLASLYLPGASFYIMTVIPSVLAFYMLIHQKSPSPFILAFLSLPAIWILAPFIKMFPVGLGLKVLVLSALFTFLLFSLLLFIIAFYQRKQLMAALALVLSIAFFVKAHLISDYTSSRPKPNSLVYILNADKSEARWATYDEEPDEWTGQFIKEAVQAAATNKIPDSKYKSVYKHFSPARLQSIAPPRIEILKDSTMGQKRMVEISITPLRTVHRMDVSSPSKPSIRKIVVNGEERIFPLPQKGDKKSGGRLFTSYINNNAATNLLLELDKVEPFELHLKESSYDLLTSELFDIPKRPNYCIPKPFILNDAVLVEKTIKFD